MTHRKITLLHQNAKHIENHIFASTLHLLLQLIMQLCDFPRVFGIFPPELAIQAIWATWSDRTRPRTIAEPIGLPGPPGPSGPTRPSGRTGPSGPLLTILGNFRANRANRADRAIRTIRRTIPDNFQAIRAIWAIRAIRTQLRNTRQTISGNFRANGAIRT